MFITYDWTDKLRESLLHDNWTLENVEKIIGAVQKYQELADKYAAALGREAELKERVRILIKRFEGQG